MAFSDMDPAADALLARAADAEAVSPQQWLAAFSRRLVADAGAVPLSLEREAEIRARAAAATPGPWCTDGWEIHQGTEFEPGAEWIGETCRGPVEEMPQSEANAAFVAGAREDVPVLLAEVDRLRAAEAVAIVEREALREQVAALAALAVDAVEYRVTGAGGRFLLVRRSSQTGRWSVGDGLLRVLEPGGRFAFGPDLSDSEEYVWPDAKSAIAAARQALAGGAA